MSERTRWRALWSALAVVATFVLILFVVDRYEKALSKINWPLVSLLSVFVFGGVAIYRWNDQLARYSVIDLVMNPTTGKPDPYRHLLFLFAGLTCWAIVQVVLAQEWENLSSLLLGALGFFVLKPTVDGVSDAIAKRPPAAERAGNTQINAPNADTINVPRVAAESATDVGEQPRRLPSAIKTLKA